MTDQPEYCPPGVHSIFDPCPGDCGKPVDEPGLAELHRHAQDLSRKTGLAVTVEPFHDQYKISVEHPAGTASHGGYDPRETHAMLLGIGMASTANAAIVQAAARAEGTGTATWTAVRAIQLMNEAGRQRDEAQAAIARLRQLHQRDGDHCATCTEDFGRLQAEWPCPTIRTLDDQPALNAGPTVAEAAADDRRWWGGEKTGEAL